MKPIIFKEANYKFTNVDGQEVPVFKSNCKKGIFVSCHKFSIKERLYVLFFGKIWFSQATFNAKPKPFLLTINKFQLFSRKKAKFDAVSDESEISKPTTPKEVKKGLTRESIIN